MEKINTKIGSILEDGAGGQSSMRFGFLLTIVIIMLGWAYVTFMKQDLQPLPDNILFLVLGFAGVKAGQRFAETKDKELESKATQPAKPTLLNG